MTWLVLSAAMAMPTTCSPDRLKRSVCWALCRKDGFDSGYYEKKNDKCYCITVKDFSDYTQPTLEIYKDYGTSNSSEDKRMDRSELPSADNKLSW